MREKLTPANVRDAEVPPKGRKIIWDAATPSFGLMVTCNGARSFVGDYRNIEGKKRRKTWPVRTEDRGAGLTIDQAKREFTKLRGDSERGHDRVQEERDQRRKAKEDRQKAEAAISTTVKAIVESYFAVECGMVRDEGGRAAFNGRLRSAPWQMRYVFEPLVYPRIGGIQIKELKRSQIVAMLDQIAKDNGPVMADRTLAHVRKALNWHASRSDDFNSPITKGMAKTKPKERAGRRVLADDEIRDIWTVCETGGKDLPDAFCRFQRCLFLAASRRTEVAAMSWFEMESLTRDDYSGEAWTCPAERMKGKLDHLVPMTAALQELIGEQPKDWRIRPYVFSTTGGKRPISGYSKAKAALDREVAALRKREGRQPMRPWTMQRDVRRTARTLLTRAQVPSEIAERVIAHEISGVEGVYNRYEYVVEKFDALTRLAALIERIVNSPAANVVPPKREA